jgi:hypothetical protein
MSYGETLPDGTILGDVPGTFLGTFLRDRQELHDKKLHRGLMPGIALHGSSIVLSAGYVDDEDLGDVIIYTGEGGRLRARAQHKKCSGEPLPSLSAVGGARTDPTCEKALGVDQR